MELRLDSNGRDLGVLWTQENAYAMWRAVNWLDRQFPGLVTGVVAGPFPGERVWRLYFKPINW